MKITKWVESLKGKKVKCLDNTSGSALTVGQIYYVRSKGGSGNRETLCVSLTKGGPKVGGWGYVEEFQLHVLTKEALLEEIEVIEKQIDELETSITYKNDLIEFLAVHDLKEADEDLFKTYRVMKRLGLGDIDAASDVVGILNA